MPENLATLDNVERLMQQRLVARIEADETLLDHVELIEAVMNHIDYFAKRDSTGDLDLETVQLLGARIFNDLASAYGQLTRGYYQIAAATLRDVMEIVYLWGYFDREPAKISEWRESDDATRREIFAPFKVRKFLDDFDGFKEGKHGKDYKMFCEYAAHATWRNLDASIRWRSGPDGTIFRCTIDEGRARRDGAASGPSRQQLRLFLRQEGRRRGLGGQP